MIFLRILLLAAHLAGMNFAAAGPLAAIWIDCRAAKQGKLEMFRLGRILVGWSLAAFAGATLLGAANGLLVWASGERQFFSALWRFWETKIFFGWWELAFYVVCVGGFWWWRSLRPEATRWQRIVSRLLLVLAGTNLLYHFPPLFSVIQMLARQDGATGPTIEAAEFRQLIATPQVIWLSVHFLLASISVAGLITGRLALRQLEPGEAEPIVGRSAMAALIATLLQLPIGTAFLFALPTGEQRNLMGGDAIATSLFAVALLSALWLMHVLAGVAFFQRTLRQVNQALSTMFGVILLMTAAMLFSRV